ncbi:hypothetical protein D9758_012460 [Tetrapyrgos nigripes]|uniref:Uncharacterized protein n=1 Tax=Tetrapyrgos nigripes TaxID=182062 RepID=A0A8H5FVE7_9AGAR|nr:hypothetical protein D9758_012460 [Tetrapyrgos nigripes]
MSPLTNTPDEILLEIAKNLVAASNNYSTWGFGWDAYYPPTAFTRQDPQDRVHGPLIVNDTRRKKLHLKHSETEHVLAATCTHLKNVCFSTMFSRLYVNLHHTQELTTSACEELGKLLKPYQNCVRQLFIAVPFSVSWVVDLVGMLPKLTCVAFPGLCDVGDWSKYQALFDACNSHPKSESLVLRFKVLICDEVAPASPAFSLQRVHLHTLELHRKGPLNTELDYLREWMPWLDAGIQVYTLKLRGLCLLDCSSLKDLTLRGLTKMWVGLNPIFSQLFQVFS